MSHRTRTYITSDQTLALPTAVTDAVTSDYAVYVRLRVAVNVSSRQTSL